MPGNNTDDLTRAGSEIGRSTDSGVRSTAAETAAADTDVPLVEIRRAETVADRTDFDAIRRELPTGWDVLPDLVQFDSEPLAETVRFRRGRSGPQIVLKPARSETPTRDIECYERDGQRAARRLTMTVESLSEALRVALNRVHQLEQ